MIGQMLASSFSKYFPEYLRPPLTLEIKGYKIPTWVCVAVPATAAFYGYLKHKSKRLHRKGFPGPTGNVLTGSTMEVLSKGIIEFDTQLHKQYGDVVGVPLGPNSVMINVQDLDMIKDICIKEFNSFSNHTPQGGNDLRPLRKMLTVLRDDHWRHVRNTLSPTFSGGKLRRMTDGINKCCKTWIDFLRKKVEKGEAVEMKEVSGFLTMDLIASTVFGLETNTADDPNNEFVKHADAIMGITRGFSIKIMLFFIMGNLLSKMGVTLFPKESMDFFVDAAEQAMKFRDQEASKKKDFIQILVDSDIGEPTDKDLKDNDDLQKSPDTGHIYSKTGLTREEVLASALFFFLAGFDTVATGLSFLAYNLACHPDKQEKLYEEISEVLGDQEPDYDLIKKMPYLEMCVEESLRMYPPAAKTERYCQEDIVINGYKFEKGMTIGIAAWCIHHNPEIYPNPDEFIPERFSAEEKAARHPMAWLPFGQGPRACIAMRLALVEVKLAIIHLLKEFRLLTCEKTEIPIKIQKLRMEGVNGAHLKLQKR